MRRVAKFKKVSFEQYCLDKGYDAKYKDIENEYNNLKLPKRATKGSAGYDFFLGENLEIEARETVRFPTGIKCQINDGYVLKLYPRSSLGFKYKLQLDNTVGIIDSDYYNNSENEGHIHVKLTNHSDNPIYLKQGDAYMQGIFVEFFITEDDDADANRVGGIGSTNSIKDKDSLINKMTKDDKRKFCNIFNSDETVGLEFLEPFCNEEQLEVLGHIMHFSCSKLPSGSFYNGSPLKEEEFRWYFSSRNKLLKDFGLKIHDKKAYTQEDYYSLFWGLDITKLD